MLTKFGRFILILNKMALYFLEVLIIFTVSSFEFQHVSLPWLHRYWWMASIHSTSIHWVIKFGDNSGVLAQVAIKVKNSSWVSQVAQLSQRNRTAGWLVMAESGRLELGDNIYGYYKSIFNHCDVFGQQSNRIRRKTQNTGYYAVRGHSRSSRSVPIESPHATSY